MEGFVRPISGDGAVFDAAKRDRPEIQSIQIESGRQKERKETYDHPIVPNNRILYRLDRQLRFESMG
jgi:hypothetical protein